jgi:uncharacterized membrane protein affecting hemolysin expression
VVQVLLVVVVVAVVVVLAAAAVWRLGAQRRRVMAISRHGSTAV